MKKRKTIVILFLIALAVTLTLVFLLINYNGGQPMEFKQIRLSVSGTASGAEVYELNQTEEGLLAQYYYENQYWSDEKRDYVSYQTMYRSEIVSQEIYVQMAEALQKYQTKSWDGYHKSNPKVLDGSSFDLLIVLDDNSTIEAHGSNCSPSGFKDFRQQLVDATTIKTITGSTLEMKQYTLQLPESWSGWVKLRYRAGCSTLYMEYGDEEEVILLALYENDYGYYDGKDYLPLAELNDAEGKTYLFCKKGNAANISTEALNESQQKIIQNVEEDSQKVIESFTLKEGFETVQ